MVHSFRVTGSPPFGDIIAKFLGKVLAPNGIGRLAHDGMVFAVGDEALLEQILGRVGVSTSDETPTDHTEGS